MPAAGIPALPSLSQVENWESSHLDTVAQQASAWRERSIRLFTQHVNNLANPGGTEWDGQAAHAAHDRGRADLDVVRKQAFIAEDIEQVARCGADDVAGAKSKTLEAVQEARDAGFSVGEDLVATETRKLSTSSTEYAKSQAEALQHTEFIRWRAIDLVKTDTYISEQLTAKAAELEDIRFDGEKSGSHDGTVHMLGDERKSPKGEADDRKKDATEPRNPGPEAGEFPSSGTPTSGGTPGGEPYPGGGLGDPIPGEKLDQKPEPPAWRPKDVGSGGDSTWKTWEPRNPGDQFDKWEIDAAREWMRDELPNAARNMDHYFDVSGAPLQQDVGQMLKDIPVFQNGVNSTAADLAAKAIEQAKASGATGPLTFPINTGWNGVDVPMNSTGAGRDWFLATGSFDYNLAGQVTVHPPAQSGGQWTYSLDTDVNYRDRYNWDISKSTPIAGSNITDSQLGRFHLIGWAKEFTMTGSTGIHRGG